MLSVNYYFYIYIYLHVFLKELLISLTINTLVSCQMFGGSKLRVFSGVKSGTRYCGEIPKGNMSFCHGRNKTDGLYSLMYPNRAKDEAIALPPLTVR